VFSQATRRSEVLGLGPRQHPEKLDDLLLDVDVANMRRNVSMISLIAYVTPDGPHDELILGERWQS
jgi:hypothetical protein